MGRICFINRQNMLSLTAASLSLPALPGLFAHTDLIRHPKTPRLSLAGFRLAGHAPATAWGFSCCHDLPAVAGCRQYPGGIEGCSSRSGLIRSRNQRVLWDGECARYRQERHFDVECAQAARPLIQRRSGSARPYTSSGSSQPIRRPI